MRLNPNALRERRILAGLSQSELGKKIGVKHSLISNYENGLHSAHPSRIKELAEALGCNTTKITMK